MELWASQYIAFLIFISIQNHIDIEIGHAGEPAQQGYIVSTYSVTHKALHTHIACHWSGPASPAVMVVICFLPSLICVPTKTPHDPIKFEEYRLRYLQTYIRITNRGEYGRQYLRQTAGERGLSQTASFPSC